MQHPNRILSIVISLVAISFIWKTLTGTATTKNSPQTSWESEDIPQNWAPQKSTTTDRVVSQKLAPPVTQKRPSKPPRKNYSVKTQSILKNYAKSFSKAKTNKVKAKRKVIPPTKKTKLNKVNASLQEIANKFENDHADTTDSDSDTDSHSDANTPPVIVQTSTNQNSQNDDFSEEYDFWSERILNSPSFRYMTEFIKAFQTNQVSKDTFYLILSDMLDQETPGMVELVILAAASTPGSDSFAALAEIMQTQPQGTTLRAKAENKLNSYSSILYVKQLDSVIAQQENDFTKILATRIIGESATRFSQALENQEATANSLDNDSDANTRSISTTRSSQDPKIFRRFLAPLASLAASSNNPELSNAAKSTHRIITELIGGDSEV